MGCSISGGSPADLADAVPWTAPASPELLLQHVAHNTEKATKPHHHVEQSLLRWRLGESSGIDKDADTFNIA